MLDGSLAVGPCHAYRHDVHERHEGLLALEQRPFLGLSHLILPCFGKGPGHVDDGELEIFQFTEKVALGDTGGVRLSPADLQGIGFNRLQRLDHFSAEEMKGNENQEGVEGNDCHDDDNGPTVQRLLQETGGHIQVYRAHLFAVDDDFPCPGHCIALPDPDFYRNDPPLRVPRKTGDNTTAPGSRNRHAENLLVAHGAFDNLVNLLVIEVPQREGEAAFKLCGRDRESRF